MRAEVIEVLAAVDAHHYGGRAKRQTENCDRNYLCWTTAKDAANELLRDNPVLYRPNRGGDAHATSTAA